MFFHHNDSPAKRRSVLNFLFNPDFGHDVRPIVGNYREFVRMLAAVFASWRMFPLDHAALRDNSAPLSLEEVLREAWRAIPRGRRGIPKACVFATIVLGVVYFIALLAGTLWFIVAAAWHSI